MEGTWTLKITLDSGQKLDLEVDPDDLVSTVLAQVDGVTGRQHEGHRFMDCRSWTWLGPANPPPDLRIRDWGVADGFKLLLTEVCQLTLTLAGGATISLEETCLATLAFVQQTIHERTGIPPYDQYLFLNGRRITHLTSSLKSHGIASGSVIEVREGPIAVTIDVVETGQSFTIRAARDDKLSTLNNKIRDQFGLPPVRQYLMHGERWLLCRSDNFDRAALPLGDITLTLVPGPMEVTMQLPSGRFVSHRCHPQDKADVFMDALECWAEVPREHSYLVGPIKWMGWCEHGRGRHYSAADLELLSVTDGSLVRFCDGNITISVETASGATHRFPVHCKDTVASIQPELQALTGVAIRDQYFRVGETLLWNADQSFRRFGVIDGGTIHLVDGPLELSIAVDGRETLNLRFHEEDSLSRLKEKIFAKTGIESNDQSIGLPYQLYFSCSTLEEFSAWNMSTFRGIAGSTLRLSHGSFPVNFQAESGEEPPWTLMVSASERISSVAERLEQAIGRRLHGLVVNGEEMRDDAAVACYGIVAGTTITPLLEQGMRISVRVSGDGRDGTTVDVFASKWCLGAGLEARIAAVIDVPPTRQRLVFGNVEIRAFNPLSLYDLHDGCTVHLIVEPEQELPDYRRFERW